MSDEDILLRSHIEDGVILRLNRPTRRNALTIELVQLLSRAIWEEASAGARAITIAATGSVFCAGGDLPQLSEVAEHGAVAVTDVIYEAFHGLVRTITTSSVPVIAAVSGAAVGAGFDLALACDLRVASPEAMFTSSWIKVGLVPGMGGAFMLPRIVGSTRAASALLLGESISASDALDWGLVNAVVPAESVIGRCEEMTRTIAKLPPVAVSRTKAALRRSISLGFAEELATLGATQGGLLSSEEFVAAAARLSR